MKNNDSVIGELITIDDFPTRYIKPRRVDIWLPPDYEKNKNDRYNVLYMHDGQNVFIPELSFTKIDWGIDEAIMGLMEKGKIGPTMAVGIWNTTARVPEYMPAKPLKKYGSKDGKLQMAPFHKKEIPLSDQYLKFLVNDLKPYIDKHYRTRPDAKNNVVMGSSMGGLISLYAVCEYPDVFGGAGCVSTHWPIKKGVVIKYMEKSLPKPGNHRFYFDFGTGNEAEYEKYQDRVDVIMRTAGYQMGKDWMTRKIPGADHNERAWRKRVHIPIEFLFKGL